MIRISATIAGLFIGLIFASEVANFAPSLLYLHHHGANPEGMTRQPAEAEIYGLKLVQMLLPTTDHRLPWLAAAGWATVAMLLAVTWLMPWYVVWLLPFAALAGSRRLTGAAIALTLFVIVVRLIPLG